MFPIEEGETVLWSGRPQRYHRRFRDYYWWVVLAVLAFGGSFVIAWFDVLNAAFYAWIIVLALVAGFAVERPKERRALLAITTYFVTDRRLVFVAHGGSGSEFRWVPLAALRAPRVHDLGDGLGTIDFRPTWWEWVKDQEYRPRPAWHPMLPELVAVRDAAQLADLIARNAARPSHVG
ncbi:MULTISPECIES: hypothetical protein [unclassified Amycolatopsis]|uniref:hypothetical protein n=1 Tax=unclassified Amycolatopsis TaxID=2618356 RepID=UPI001C69D0F8|nr:hypothetical protein [Amycolatopsis sp. DSM 110486]QYN22565.1 hypothetical protein K1T34_08855 [Amycolatopsis sp. DSM 110486]